MTDVVAEPPIPLSERHGVAELLDLAPMGENRFCNRVTERNEHGRIFGGQMLGQAVTAAARTVSDNRPATYLQFLFAAGGIPEQAIEYEVGILQDGKRFASRSVQGAQAGGRIVCSAGVSFARRLEGPTHAERAPADSGWEVDPERLPGLKDIDAPEARAIERTSDFTFRNHPLIDLRFPFVDDVLRGVPGQARVRFWTRIRSPLGNDPNLHAAAFAYLSDFWINFVASIAHAGATAEAGGKLYIASLNHTLWLHTPFRADNWLLFDSVSPRAALGRGLATARIYTQSGEAVASGAQECLLAPM